MKIPLHMRLDCSNSFATTDDFHLRCEIGGGVCDGTLYECCMWDKSFANEMALIKVLMEQEGGQE